MNIKTYKKHIKTHIAAFALGLLVAATVTLCIYKPEGRTETALQSLPYETPVNPQVRPRMRPW